MSSAPMRTMFGRSAASSREVKQSKTSTVESVRMGEVPSSFEVVQGVVLKQMLTEDRAMGKITLDAATAEALKSAAAGTELIGPDGQTIGAYVPRNIIHDLLQMLGDRKRMYDEAFAAVSLEDLIAADREGGEVPMAEVFKLVEKYGG